MLFYPEPNKQSVEIFFSKKNVKKASTYHVQTGINQKHLGLVLGFKLHFNEYIK